MTDLTKDEIVKMAREAGAAPEDGVSGFWVAQTEDLQRFYTLCRAPLVAENAALKQAHEINADTLNAMQVEIDDWKARAEAAEAELARVRAGEPFGWYSAKEDDFMLDKIRKTHERLNSHTHRIGKYDLALYTTPPRPAAQEPFAWARPDAVDTSQDFRFIKIDDFTVPLYTTPPRPAAQEPFAWARPDAVDTSQDFRFIKIDDFTVPLYTTPPSAVPVVEQLVEALSRNRIMAADSDGNYTREVTPRVITAAIAAGQKFIKENGK